MTSKEPTTNKRAKLKGGAPCDNPSHGSVFTEQTFSDSMRA